MATTQGEIRVGPQNQVKDIYVRAKQKDGNIQNLFFFKIKYELYTIVFNWHDIFSIRNMHDVVVYIKHVTKINTFKTTTLVVVNNLQCDVIRI